MYNYIPIGELDNDIVKKYIDVVMAAFAIQSKIDMDGSRLVPYTIPFLFFYFVFL